MGLALPGKTAFLVTFVVLSRSSAWAAAQDSPSNDRLSLADLVHYRAALAGKPTADNAKASDQPVRVVFKDLWDRPEAFRGRRVTIEGRTERIFRQTAVGDFPALAEIWIASTSGDPFCLVIPQKPVGLSVSSHNLSSGTAAPRGDLPKLGQNVRFIGTFLKLVRYTAGDGDRLAPLVVGDQPPMHVRDDSKAAHEDLFPSNARRPNQTPWAGSWFFGLAVLLVITAAFVFRRSRAVLQRIDRQNQQRGARASLGGDPPLEFVQVADHP
jgi:hypothetical protein